MKKLLSILGALTLTASSSAAVVSCGTEQSNEDKKEYLNNDLNNIFGAAFGKAQGVILDAEYGISQKTSSTLIGNQLAKNTAVGFNKNDQGLNENSNMNSLINKYFSNKEVTNDVINSSNFKIGNTNGDTSVSGIAAILPNNLQGIFGQIINPLVLAMDTSKGFVTSENMVALSNALYGAEDNSTIKSVIDFLNKNVVSKIGGITPTITGAIEGLIGNTSVQSVKQYINTLLNDETGLKAVIYNNAEMPKFEQSSSTYDEQVRTLISDVKVSDVMDEIFISIDVILNNILDLNDVKEHNLSNDLGYIFGKLITKEELKTKEIKTDQIMVMVKESLRIITLLNAYFNVFDQTKDVVVKDQQHLFDNEKNNIDFIAQFSDKKLGEASDYVKDKAINLNYFAQNINYYFASLSNSNEQSVFRLEQAMFLMMVNGKETIKSNEKTYANYSSVKSSLSDLVTNTLYQTLVNGKIIDIDLTPSEIEGFNNIIKMLVIGIANGDPIIDKTLELITDLIKDIDNNINGFGKLKPYKEMIKQVRIILENIQFDKDIKNNLTQFLFNGDIREILAGTNLIPEDMLNKIFVGHKANIFNLVNKPLNEILTMFNVSGFENGKVPKFAEFYTKKSVFELLSIFLSTMNESQNNQLENNWMYTGKTPETSLKLFNLNTSALNNLINSILGDTPKNNIISVFLNNLLSKDGIKLKELMTALGMTGANTFNKNSFIGSLLQLNLPLMSNSFDETGDDQNNGGEDNAGEDNSNEAETFSDSISLKPEDYKVDLFNVAYNHLVQILVNLNGTYDPYYTNFINQILTQEKVFDYKIDPNKVKYFEDIDGLIKSFEIKVNFYNKITLKTDSFIFKASRNSNTEVFEFNNMTSNINLPK